MVMLNLPGCECIHQFLNSEYTQTPKDCGFNTERLRLFQA
jgi:hypothetical protein